MVETVCWKPGVSEKNSTRKLADQAACLRPGTEGSARDQERPPRIICLLCVSTQLHTAYERSYSHDGYRGCGRRNGRVVRGAGSECRWYVRSRKPKTPAPPKEARIS